MYFAGNGRSPKSEGMFGFGRRINRKSLTAVSKMQEKANEGSRPYLVANTNPNLLNVPISPGNERSPFVPYLELAKTPELPPKNVPENPDQENLLSTRRLNTVGDGGLRTEPNDDGLPAPMSYIRDLLSQEDDYTLEDGFKTKLEFQKLQIMDNATTLTAFIGGILVVLNYDLEYEERDEDVSRVLLWMLFGSTWVTIGLNFIRYLQKMKFFRARMTYSSRDTLWSTGNIWTLLAETVILLIQPYPFLIGIKIDSYDSFIQLDFYYHLNEIFAVLFVGRLYLLCRCVLNNLMYRSPRAYRVGDMYGADNGYMYAVRSVMKVSPFKMVPILLGLSIFVFGYMLRVCERPLNRNPEAIAIEMNTYWNAMWCVVLTMTTVGYGDVYARTIFGRIVSFVMCMWGITIVSIMVVTITNVLTMDNLEEKALVVLRRLEMKKVQKKEAAFILTNIAKLGLIKKRYSNLEIRNKKNQEVVGELRKHLNSFKQITRRIKGVEDNVGAYEEVNRQIGNVREDVKVLMEKQEEFQKTILELLTGNAQLPNLSPQVSIARSRKASVGVALVVESRLNINDTEEDVVIAKTAR